MAQLHGNVLLGTNLKVFVTEGQEGGRGSYEIFPKNDIPSQSRWKIHGPTKSMKNVSSTINTPFDPPLQKLYHRSLNRNDYYAGGYWGGGGGGGQCRGETKHNNQIYTNYNSKSE